MVCTACYYERLRLQILLGSPPAEMVALLPRLDIGPIKGESLVHAVHEWVETAQGEMRGDSGSVELGFSFGLTDQVGSESDLGDRDPAVLQADELVSLFSYRFTPDPHRPCW
jgi:hypothetical protein